MPTQDITQEVAQSTSGSGIINLLGFDIGAIILTSILALFTIIFFYILGKILARSVRRNIIKNANTENETHTNKVATLVGEVTFYVTMILGFFVGFELIGLNVGLIVGGISFGVGLAFKEILGNMIAGILILYTKELKLGDIIEIKGNQEYFGRIEQITIRYTTLRTLDLRQIIIPNITLISSPIKTFSAEEIIKLYTEIGIHYDTDIEKAIEVIKDSINQFDFIKEKQNTKAYITKFEDSEILIKCIFFFNPNEGLLAEYVIGHIHEAIIKNFAQNDIKMAYPHVTLRFDEKTHLETLRKQLKI